MKNHTDVLIFNCKFVVLAWRKKGENHESYFSNGFVYVPVRDASDLNTASWRAALEKET